MTLAIGTRVTVRRQGFPPLLEPMPGTVVECNEPTPTWSIGRVQLDGWGNNGPSYWLHRKDVRVGCPCPYYLTSPLVDYAVCLDCGHDKRSHSALWNRCNVGAKDGAK